VKINVRARLFCSGGTEEIVEGVLTNELPEAKDGDCVLLVDGAIWTERYDVLSDRDRGAPS
jgi:hypothetical protein